MTGGLVPIPDWDERGLLPPYLGEPTLAASSPPYPVRIAEIAIRLANSEVRRELFSGFLDFRQNLHNAGITEGFQWVNGSFVENTLQRRGREPADFDVVTFFQTPTGSSQIELSTLFPELFKPGSVKSRYGIDAYFVGLDVEDKFYLTKATAFWNNLWYHTREGERKGYLAVDLSLNEDKEARQSLNQDSDKEATP